MAGTTRAGLRTLLRRGSPPGLPRELVDRMYDDLERGTRRAVVELYRSVTEVGAAVDGFLARRRGPDPAGSPGPPAEEVPADARQREAEHPGHLGR
jgi:hypothetical protein